MSLVANIKQAGLLNLKCLKQYTKKKFDNSSLNPNLKLEIHCRCGECVRDVSQRGGEKRIATHL